jgi:hypothetical protein
MKVQLLGSEKGECFLVKLTWDFFEDMSPLLKVIVCHEEEYFASVIGLIYHVS